MSSTHEWIRSKRIPKKKVLDENFEYSLPGSKTPRLSSKGIIFKTKRQPINSQHRRKSAKKRPSSEVAKEVREVQKIRRVCQTSQPVEHQTATDKSLFASPQSVQREAKRARAVSPCSTQASSLKRGQCLFKLPRPLSDKAYWQPLVLLSTCGCNDCAAAMRENDSHLDGASLVSPISEASADLELSHGSPSLESASSSTAIPQSETSSVDPYDSLSASYSNSSDSGRIHSSQFYASISHSPRCSSKKRVFKKKLHFSRTPEPPESSLSESDLPPAERKENSNSKIVNKPVKAACYSSPRKLKKRGSDAKVGEDGTPGAAPVSRRGRPPGRPPGMPRGRPPGMPRGRPPGRPRGRPPGRPRGRPPGRPPGRPQGRPRGRPRIERGDKPITGVQRSVGKKQVGVRRSLQKGNVRTGVTKDMVKASGSSHIRAKELSRDSEECKNGTNRLQFLRSSPEIYRKRQAKIKEAGTAQASLSKNVSNDSGDVREFKADTDEEKHSGTCPKMGDLMSRGKNTVKETSASPLRRTSLVVSNDGEMLPPDGGKVGYAVAANKQPGSSKKAPITSYDAFMKHCASAVVILKRVDCDYAGKKRAVDVGEGKGPAHSEESLEISPEKKSNLVVSEASDYAPSPLNVVVSGDSDEGTLGGCGDGEGDEGGDKVSSTKGHVSGCESNTMLKPCASPVVDLSRRSADDRGVSHASDTGAIEDSVGSNLHLESSPEKAGLRASGSNTPVVEDHLQRVSFDDSTEMMAEGAEDGAAGSPSSHVLSRVLLDDPSGVRQYRDGIGGRVSFRHMPLSTIAYDGANEKMGGNLHTEESVEISPKMQRKYFTRESKTIRLSASPLVSPSAFKSNDPEERGSDVAEIQDSAPVQSGAVSEEVSVVHAGPSFTSRSGAPRVSGIREDSSNDPEEVDFQNVENRFESMSSKKEESEQTMEEKGKSKVPENEEETVDVPSQKSNEVINIRDVCAGSSVLSCSVNSRLEEFGHSSGITVWVDDEDILEVNEGLLDVEGDPLDVDLHNVDMHGNVIREYTALSSLKGPFLLECAQRVVDNSSAMTEEIEYLLDTLRSKNIEIALLKHKLSKCTCNL